MFGTNLKRPLLAIAVTAGLLAVAGPASAGTTNEPKGGPPTNATSTSAWAWHEAARSVRATR